MTTCQFPDCANEGTVQVKRWHGVLCESHGAQIEFLSRGLLPALFDALKEFNADRLTLMPAPEMLHTRKAS